VWPKPVIPKTEIKLDIVNYLKKVEKERAVFYS
jgi:hypothetical protein